MAMWDSAGIPENGEHFFHWRMRLFEQTKGPEHEGVTSCRDGDGGLGDRRLSQMNVHKIRSNQ